MPKVDPALKAVFRQLCSGEALWPLYLWGPPGRGKTCASLALADYASDVLYVTPDILVDKLLAGDIDWYWRALGERSFAILDELGSRHRDSDAHYQVVKRFADQRDLCHRVAVYVSNVKPSEIVSHYDDRVANRVLCGTVHLLDGPCRRSAEKGTE